MSALFFFDILPRFGSSTSMEQFVDNFRFGWMCLANSQATWVQALSDRCHYNGGLALLFVAFYVTTYVFSTLATRHASANLLSTVTTLAPIAALVFWLEFPGLNTWGGGADYTPTDAGYNIGALGLILPGIVLFHYYTPRDPRKMVSVQEEDDAGLEICLPCGN
jgi:hypothetical protein